MDIHDLGRDPAIREHTLEDSILRARQMRAEYLAGIARQAIEWLSANVRTLLGGGRRKLAHG